MHKLSFVDRSDTRPSTLKSSGIKKKKSRSVPLRAAGLQLQGDYLHHFKLRLREKTKEMYNMGALTLPFLLVCVPLPPVHGVLTHPHLLLTHTHTTHPVLALLTRVESSLSTQTHSFALTHYTVKSSITRFFCLFFSF